MSALKIVKELKEKGQDFEFYPTTREILEALYWDINGPLVSESTYRGEAKRISILDIGAGHCKLYNTFKEIAESQPILSEYFYHTPNDAERYEKLVIKKVLALKEYRKRMIVILNDGNKDFEDNIHMDQFMLMIPNSNLDEIDFSDLEYTERNLTNSEKEILLENIRNYEKSKSYRSERERLANRIYFEKYMAIEKSQILINNMPNDVFVVGTEFNENTLIDKKADIVFCNPPYSEFSQWSVRIITEANAKVIYLVIPKRWGNQANIAQAIKQRKAISSIVGDFDFFDSEDRKARARVSLVKIDLRGKISSPRYGHRLKSEEIKVDPFDLWFNETFKINAKKTEESDYQIREQKAKEHKENVKNALVNGSDLVSSLVELYNRDLTKLTTNYLKVSELDADILKELNVDVKNLLSAFKSKIEGLKNLYWQEIFNNLDSITTRLTSRTREGLLKTLTSNTNIDFTSGNIRSVVIWVIKNSSKYFNNQMLEVYDDFTTGEGISFYKSNTNFMNDTWRYCRGEKDKLGKYALDYRIVLHGYRSEYGYDRDKDVLSDAQKQYIKDIVIIAKNLGFVIDDISYERLTLKDKHNTTFNSNKKDPLKVGTKTLDGKIEEVYCQTHIPNENGEEIMEKDGVTYVYRKDQDYTWYQYKVKSIYKDGGSFYINHDNIRTEKDIFTTVRGHSNGNVHFQFNQEFIKKLNLEVGRLRGWIKTPQEAAEEFDISLEDANAYWKSTYELLPSAFSHLLPQLKKEPSYKIESIENDEVGLYENEALIYKSQMGSVIALTEITLEDIPEDISKKFMDEVFKNSTLKRGLTVSDNDFFDIENCSIIEIEDPLTIENKMYFELTEDILKIYDNGTLLGKKNTNGSMSYSVTNHFASVNEDYKAGKYEGLSYSAQHKDIDTAERKTTGIKVYRTKYESETPFVPVENSSKILPIEEFEEFLKINRDNCSIEELSLKFKELINSKTSNDSIITEKAKDDLKEKSKTITVKKEMSLFDFLDSDVA